MEQFETDKEECDKEISQHQYVIGQLLEHMQKTLARQNKLPGQAEFAEMKNDLNFKNRQMEASETTAARLRV